ncbi:hypothetical protein BC827DRAFT_584361 [Russula dissimulans]|nr:hypothetical protein BC827DRAFT_584361 [Russula dissimulans]
MLDPLRGTASEGHLTQPRAQGGERGSQVWGASVGLLSREGRRTCYDSAHLTDRPVTESPTPPRPAGPVPPCGPVSRWAGATTRHLSSPHLSSFFPLIPSFPSMAKARSFPPSDLAALAETVSPFPFPTCQFSTARTISPHTPAPGARTLLERSSLAVNICVYMSCLSSLPLSVIPASDKRLPTV